MADYFLPFKENIADVQDNSYIFVRYIDVRAFLKKFLRRQN